MTEYTPPKLIELVTPQDYKLGIDSATTTIVEYGDYECFHCGNFNQIIRELLQEYGTNIKYVYRHFPVSSLHPDARLAAQAVEAAAEQGKFWQMHHLLFDNQRDLSRNALLGYAAELALDLEQFENDMDSDKIKARVDDDFEKGVRSGVNGTPTLFINDIRYDGAWDVNSLREHIEQPVGLKIQLLGKRFTELAVFGGFLLFFFTLLALIISNSSLGGEYFTFWKKYFVISIGDIEFKETLIHMVNDGLMSIFFLIVGLEIKRELLVGELSSRKKVMLPLFGALGGMLVPALVYVAINWNNPETISGWAIPTATDIAFALVILSFLDDRIPSSLRIFFSALAIVDDLGAILIISLFYSADLQTMYLLYAAILLLVLIILNRLRIYSLLPYIIFGVIMWYMVLESGIHPTIAGVLIAFTIPSHEAPNTKNLVAQCNTLLITPAMHDLSEESYKHAAVSTLETMIERLQSPAQKLEHDLHPWTTYLILPIFALANAGIALSGVSLATFAEPVTLGIILGLVVGKPIGILFFAWIAVKMGIATLPSQVSWKELGSLSFVMAIGFTMSLFITNIAFEGNDIILNQAKIGILVASALAAVIGLGLGFMNTNRIGNMRSGN